MLCTIDTQPRMTRERRAARLAERTRTEFGGTAACAPPPRDCDDPHVALTSREDFAAARLDGVEAFCVGHTEPQTRLLAERSRELGPFTATAGVQP
jgi:hypothetical protein